MLLETVGDASAREVVDGQLDGDAVARQNLDVVHAHLAGDMRQDLVAVFEFDLEHGVRESLQNLAFKLDDVFFRQNLTFSYR